MAERVNIREQVYQKNRGYGLQPTIQNSEYQVGNGKHHCPEMDNLSDGRLLPVNLLSPTIHGGREVMAKLEELLAGKRHSNFLYSKAEIAALKGRPMNRIVTPKKMA